MQIKTGHLILGFFLIVLTIVLGFTGLLVVSDFQLNFADSLVSSYEVSGQQSVNNIEYALRYGKPLENFFGIEEILEDVKGDFPGISAVQIISTDGRVMYDTDGQLEDVYLSPELQELSAFEDSGEDLSYRYDTYEEDYHIFLPIYDRYEEWQGSLQITFPDEIINNRVSEVTGELLVYLLIMAIIGLFILFLLSRRMAFIDENGQLNRKRFLMVTMVLLGLIQVIFGWLNYTTFQDEYLEIADENVYNLSTIIGNDIRSVVDRGVSFDQLYRLEDYLTDISENVPEIDSISLQSPDGDILYTTEAVDDGAPSGAGEVDKIDLPEDPSMVYTRSLGEDWELKTASLHGVLSEDYLAQRMQNILLDSMTMLLLSLVVMIEIVIFMIIILQWQYDKRYHKKREDSELTSQKSMAIPDVTTGGTGASVSPEISSRVIRMLVLIIGMAVFMSASFIPLRMQELYEPLLGLSKDIVLGLPISAEMLFAAIATILAGTIIDRRGWRPVIFAGLMVFAGGLFLSYYAPDAVTFITARALTGAGYGLALLAARGFVNEIPTEKERTEVFSDFVAGLYAGFIVGTVIGAMLADRMGFAQVFLVSMGLSIAAILFVLVFLKPKFQSQSQPRKQTEPEEEPEVEPVVETNREESGAAVRPGYGVLGFLMNSKVLGFLILIVLPLTVCSMFVDYFFPIFASGQGSSTANVGRAFMLNGIAIAYLGPILSKYTRDKLGVRKALLASGILISGSLILFYGYSTLTVAFLVVVLMGVSESFGLVAQNNYFLNLEATNAFGKGAALGYSENIRKMGQMMGPFVFGGAVAMGSLGIGLIGAVTLLMLVFFLVNSARGNHPTDKYIDCQ